MIELTREEALAILKAFQVIEVKIWNDPILDIIEYPVAMLTGKILEDKL